MSEQAPRSNPRLENFENAKAKVDQEKFEESLYGDAGTTDFSEEARRRVEEADEYERHMERMAQRDDPAPLFEEGAGEVRGYEFNPYPDLNDKPSRAYELEKAEAFEMNEARNAEIQEAEARERVAQEAMNAKIAADPLLRMADKISREYQAARNKAIDPDAIEEDKKRMLDLGDRLNEVLIRYSKSDDYDVAIADFMMDRDDEGARKSAAERAHRESTGEKDELNDGLDDAPNDGSGDGLDELPKADTDADIDVDLDESPKSGDNDGLDELPRTGNEHDDIVDSDIDVNLDGPSKKSGYDLDDTAVDSRGYDDYDFSGMADDALDEDKPYDAEDLGWVNFEERGKLEDKASADRKALRKEKLVSLGKFFQSMPSRLHIIYTGVANPDRRTLKERYQGNRKKTLLAFGAIAVAGAAAAIWGIDNLHDHAKNASDALSTPTDNGFDPTTPGHSAESVPTPDVVYSSDALRVDGNEGWLQTMAEAGIKNPNTQHAILNNDSVMQKLADMNLAYRAPDLGGWGMNMPANGKMPEAGLDILRNAAK